MNKFTKIWWMFSLIFMGCSGGQTLRGIDNNRTNTLEKVPDVQFEKMPWNINTAESEYTTGILWGLWIITILTCCFLLWKDKKVR